MSETNALFLMATREKFRFPSVGGSLNAEDLWDLPLTSARGNSLDNVARAIHKSLKDAEGEVSFVKPAVKTTTMLEAQLAIVKHVIETRQAENAAVLEAKDKSERKQKLLEALANKQNEKLGSMSEEELKAAIAGI